jgi:hypothetical protein
MYHGEGASGPDGYYGGSNEHATGGNDKHVEENAERGRKSGLGRIRIRAGDAERQLSHRLAPLGGERLRVGGR